jgi:uncharacterized protein involved in outer membrane biogenesis
MARRQTKCRATHAHVRGTLPAPIDLGHFQLRTDVSGQDLADLYTLLDFPVPESPPYALSGLLERNDSIIAYRNFSGRIGDTDMAGDLTVDVGPVIPFARGKLVSRHLDLDDLAVLVGAPPATGAGETANARQRADAAEHARSTRLLPDRSFDLLKLRLLDADITLEAGEVESKKLPIDALAARFQLDGGMLKVHPLDVRVAGGDVEGSVSLDARRHHPDRRRPGRAMSICPFPPSGRRAGRTRARRNSRQRNSLRRCSPRRWRNRDRHGPDA